MVDNLKSAVLQRAVGEAPVLNPRYKDFADHFGFAVSPCGVGQAHEKGRVENAVGYVKKNFLAGLEPTDFCQLNPAARQWLDAVANVRLHGSTKQRPVDLFAAERPALRPLPIAALRPGRHPAGKGQQPVPRAGGHQHLFGPRRICLGRPDAQALSRLPVRLPSGQAHRPPRPPLRPPPGL